MLQVDLCPLTYHLSCHSLDQILEWPLVVSVVPLDSPHGFQGPSHPALALRAVFPTAPGSPFFPVKPVSWGSPFFLALEPLIIMLWFMILSFKILFEVCYLCEIPSTWPTSSQNFQFISHTQTWLHILLFAFILTIGSAIWFVFLIYTQVFGGKAMYLIHCIYIIKI